MGKHSLWILLTGCILLAGCGAAPRTAPEHPRPLDGHALPHNPSPSPVKPLHPLPSGKIDHVVIVLEENHSYGEIIGNPNAPFLQQLARHGAVFSQYHATGHPSQPNYLDLFSGSNQGIHDDSCPHTLNAPNLGRALLDAHRRFGGYSEDLPSIGYTGCSNASLWKLRFATYVRKHAPWTNFSNVPPEVNLPMTLFPRRFEELPAVSFVIPNLRHDMHDGTVQEADNWLRANLGAYAGWAPLHRSLLIIVWDEDDQSAQNHVPLIIAGAMVQPGVYTDPVNHWNLLRTVEDLFQLPPAGKSAAAAPIVSIW